MSDRLKDLQRQRALAQEQLAWLDREIARETGGKAATPPTSTAAATTTAETTPVIQPTGTSPDDIIAEYQKHARPVHSEVRRGCFLYFFSALGLVILALLGFYFLRRH